MPIFVLSQQDLDAQTKPRLWVFACCVAWTRIILLDLSTIACVYQSCHDTSDVDFPEIFVLMVFLWFFPLGWCVDLAPPINNFRLNLSLLGNFCSGPSSHLNFKNVIVNSIKFQKH